MAKVKLTKNELKRQKDMLKRFERYLPTLILKKQQLQMVIRQIEAEEAKKIREKTTIREDLDSWIAVFGEDQGIETLVAIEALDTETGNIAGVDIPVFKNLTFTEKEYDLFAYPYWIDTGVKTLKQLLSVDAEIRILQEQRRLLEEELQITTQRVNLFEKVKIPETKENIRMIRIYLGDEQTAAVVRGKISKNKIEKAS
jgi:V/A-type H+/Na+-transporting ATPase subunit D